MLYQATTIAAAAAVGSGRTLQASEADLQYNASRGGRVIQHGHFVSAAPTHLAVSAMLSPFGMTLGSLTYPLHMQQVQGPALAPVSTPRRSPVLLLANHRSEPCVQPMWPVHEGCLGDPR